MPDMADIAIHQRRPDDMETQGRRLEILALENPETNTLRHLQERDQRVVIQLATPIMNPGIAEIELPSG